MRVPTYTIADVARLAGISERQVRRDVAAGTIDVVRLASGRIRIRKTDVAKYRQSAKLATTRHLKPSAYARLVGRSLRTVRAWISSGRLKVKRLSARRQAVVIPSEVPEDVISRLEHQARQRELSANAGDAPLDVTVRQVAALAGQTTRQVRAAIYKGALPARQLSERRFGAWSIAPADARDYIDAIISRQRQ